MGKRHSPEQIIRKLRQVEAKLTSGSTVSEVARGLGISEATFHRWKNHYGGMSTSEASQGTGVRERPPQEASRRKGAGHGHPKGGEPGKLLSIRPGGRLPSSTFGDSWGSPSVGRAG